MIWLYIVGLSLASSIDNLAVALAYGLSGIRVGWLANLLIAMVCFVLSAAGGYFGVYIADLLPGTLPDIIGAVALLVVGLRVLVMVLPARRSSESGRPTRAAAVGVLEALTVGVTLSANALVNAAGGGLIGASPLAIALGASIGSLVTVALGVYLGSRTQSFRLGGLSLGRLGSLLGGVLLVGMALAKII